MNKRLLPIACVAVLVAPSMAQIPNGGFETWNAGPGYDDPDQWVTYNSVTWTLGSVLSCEQGTPGAVGASYVKVTTHNVNGTIYPGWIFTGDQLSGIGGFPYTLRPTALNGQWQYNILPGDYSVVTVSMSKWNAGTQTSDAVGAGVAGVQPGTLNTWQTFSAPITYLSVEYPDTAIISILSSAVGGVAGSTISVDDLSFGPSVVGVAEHTADPGFQLHPSPASDQVRISACDRLAEVIVLDMRGRELRREALNGRSAVVEVATLPAGIYLARVRFAGGQLAAQPFVKN